VGRALPARRLVAPAGAQSLLSLAVLHGRAAADDRMAVPLSGRPETRHLVIFVKAPRLGRVKRRLARDVGAVEAWTFYRRTVEDAARRLWRERRWRRLAALAPDGAAHAGYRWRAIPRCGQGRGDIGARMYRALQRPPPGSVVLIGGDIPDVGPRHVAEAFR